MKRDGRHSEAPYEFYESRNKHNIDLNKTYHLHSQGDLTALKWSICLRQKDVNPWKKAKKSDKIRSRTSAKKR